MRVLFLGMTNDTSTIVLDTLCAAGVDLCGVMVGTAGRALPAPIACVIPPTGRSLLPIANPFLERTIVHIAWERSVPVFEVGRMRAPETHTALAELRPDLACVACFPHRIPPSLLALPQLGFLNMHPSLLPDYRGPEPLFWTLRNGEQATGVTIHFMDERLDTGDIAAQAPLALPDGISGGAAERLCAALGGRLMAETVRALHTEDVERRGQPDGGSYYPAPGPGDWTISPAWPARRAFNFMRGTAEWGQPYPIETGGERLVLVEALGYDADMVLGQPYTRDGREIVIQFMPGILRATIADT